MECCALLQLMQHAVSLLVRWFRPGLVRRNFRPKPKISAFWPFATKRPAETFGLLLFIQKTACYRRRREPYKIPLPAAVRSIPNPSRSRTRSETLAARSPAPAGKP